MQTKKMKAQLFFILFLITTNIYTQIPAIDVNGKSPLWTHVAQDPQLTEEKGSWSDKYQATTYYFVADIYKDKLLATGVCFNMKGTASGNFYSIINPKNGIVEWSTFINTYNGNSRQEFYSDFFIADDTLVISGRQKLGDPIGVFPYWFAPRPCLYSQIKIDLTDGKQLSKKIDENDTIGYEQAYLNGRILFNPSTGYSYNVTQDVRSIVYFNKIDNNMRIASKDSVQFATDTYRLSTIYQPSYNYNSFASNNQGRVAGIYISLDSIINAQSKVAYMPIIDFSNFDNNQPQVIGVVDFKDKLILPPSTYGFLPFIGFDHDRIDLTCYYVNNENKARIWMLSHDLEGNELFYLDKIKIGNHDYENVRAIKNNQKIPYYIAWPSMKAGAEFDIVTINNSGVMKFVVTVDMSSTTTGTKTQAYGANLIDDVLIIRSTVDTRYSMLAAYKFSELLSSLNDNSTPNSHVEIHPNPAYNFISVTVENIEHVKSLNVLNNNGQLILSRNVTQKDINIDISHLIPGTYSLTLYDTQEKPISSKQFIKVQ